MSSDYGKLAGPFIIIIIIIIIIKLYFQAHIMQVTAKAQRTHSIALYS